ncbi:coproporphyrinogen III oxidase family protein [Sulfurospirillum sp.]|nr:coproporphyrinogen III oxidase family protein [Sulfurospirillum sp.]
MTIFSAKKIMEKSLFANLNLNIIENYMLKNINQNKSYLLYIHVPFCDTFCPYCSFHKFKYDEQTSINYFKNLRKEMMIVKEKGFKFSSIYVGGGTPFTNEKELILTLELAKKLFEITEVSCETDPNHIRPSTLMHFDGLIDRLSIGIQTFNDDILKKFSRYKKFGSSYELQQKLFMIKDILPITNIDLMFNIPMQTKEMLLNDLKIAKNLNIDQITMYPLMSSNITKQSMTKIFNQQRNSNEYEYYKIIQEEFKTYKQNNAWTFSKKNITMSDEYIGSNAEYIGIGSGAFSFLGNTLYINAFNLKQYETLINSNNQATIAKCDFDLKNKIKYQFLTCLFNGPINISIFNKSLDIDIEQILKKELFLMKKLNTIYIKNKIIYPTKFGNYINVVLMSQFYSGIDKIRAYFK